MSQVIEMPLWGLLGLLAVAWGTTWLNAWYGMRLVRRNGRLLQPPQERLEAEQARRKLAALRGSEDVLPAECDGEVLE
jgi:hypothetical protein